MITLTEVTYNTRNKSELAMRSQSAFCAGAEKEVKARNRRIKVCEEMGPKGFAKEVLDSL